MLEICCGSYYDAVQAACGCAKRIELNSGLHLGGLTPSLGTLELEGALRCENSGNGTSQRRRILLLQRGL